MRLGIIGLPYVGKTTVFNALTRSQAKTGGFGASGNQPNLAVVRVPDERIDRLAEMYKPKKITYATVEYLDIAGFEQGASRSKESEQFISHARKVDALIHVVRAFEDPNVLSVGETVNPKRDFNILESELILTDLVQVETRLERIAETIRRGKKPDNPNEQGALERCKEALEAEKPLRELEFSPEEFGAIKSFAFLTLKPELVVVNIGEDQIGQDESAYQDIAPGKPVVVVCGKLEAELSQLDEAEAKDLMQEYGIEESSLNRMIKVSYDLLGLISFLTAGEDEVRAWTIRKGTSAHEAAGEIHSDIQRGFIRAETIAYDDLMSCGSMAKAKEKALLRLEGKEYTMKDGDIVNFRFNV
ncbi:MAG: redox-regulated ATPase YchF [Bacteroidota bacterium]